MNLSLINNTIGPLILVMLGTPCFASSQNNHIKTSQLAGESSDNTFEEDTRPKKKAKRKKRAKRSKKKTSPTTFGIGVNLGYESSYGQSVTSHLTLGKIFDLHAGLGTNNSGIKAGLGTDFIFDLSRSLNLRTGLAFVFSAGTDGSITLEGNITEEDGSAGTIKASRPYELGSALLTSLRAGGTFKLNKSFHLVGILNYNIVVNGNEITFTDDIRYHESADVTNREEANQEFEDEASSRARSGGAGLSLGAILWL